MWRYVKDSQAQETISVRVVQGEPSMFGSGSNLIMPKTEKQWHWPLTMDTVKRVAIVSVFAAY